MGEGYQTPSISVPAFLFLPRLLLILLVSMPYLSFHTFSDSYARHVRSLFHLPLSLASGVLLLCWFSFPKNAKQKKCENQMSLLSEQSMGCEKWWELLRKDYPSSNLTDFFILSRYYLKNNRIWQKHQTTTIKGMVYSFTHTKTSLTPFGSLFAPVSLFLLGRSCFVARLGFTWLGSFSWSSLAGREVLSQCSQFFRRAHFCKKTGKRRALF